jgi:outer membrane protein assembly factor BamB
MVLCLAGAREPARATAQWPQFLGGPSHGAYSADPAISTSNAPAMGVKWMANLFSSDLGSPVVAYNSTLGKEVVYVGDERADLYAIDADTGQSIWSTNLGLGDAERATPAVAPDGSVWIGTNWNATLYKLDGATGQVLCSIKSPDAKPIMGSPMIVTPPSGTATVYWDAIDSGTYGPVVATNESTCAQIFNDSLISGSWVTPVYGVDGSGEPIVITGTADPASTVAAYDAITGSTLWTYQTYFPSTTGGWDIGAAATISPPGVNGFADGVAYMSNEYGYQYALDLATGTPLWTYITYAPNFNGKRYIISSAALDGNQLVYGYFNGLVSLNATTGAANWVWTAPAGIDSSPAIIGPPGSEVIAFADLNGTFHVFSLSAGASLYSFQTGSYVTASPAEYNGTIYLTSADGFLYAFAPGGGNGATPTETITSPSNGSTVANPDGSLTITGTATDATSVSSVEVAVQSGGASGPWYDATAKTWNSAPIRNEAALSSPGAASTTWSFSLPVPPSGDNFEVFAFAANGSHLSDKGGVAYFTVAKSKDEPTAHTSSYDVSPGGTFTATGSAFKPDENVTFTLFGNVVATVTADTTGNVPITKIQIPSTASFGPTSLMLTGQTSGKSVSTTLFISNEWTQYGYSPLRTAMEPNDYVIAHTIFAGASILNVDWKYTTSAAINTSPAIVHGIAYFGNDAGVVNAVRTAAGSPVWSYTIPSGAAIRSSPAVDQHGQVIFGANDGKLYLLNSNGQLVASTTLGGNLGAPASAAGSIVIASSTGMVYSLSDPALTQNWSANAGAAVSAPPVYDGQAGLVLVGNGNGLITAYSASTGAIKWTATATQAVTALAVGGKQLFAASADGYVYAFDAGSGALNWKITGDGSSVTALDVNGGGPAFATAKGNMYDVRATGKIYYSRFYTASPIMGLAGAGTDEFGATQGGDLEMLRTNDGGWHWQSGAQFGVGPVILDGMLFAGSQDGTLYAFTPEGYTPPPQASIQVGTALVTVDGTGCTPAQTP